MKKLLNKHFGLNGNLDISIITFAGPLGSGKTNKAKQLSTHLTMLGIRNIYNPSFNSVAAWQKHQKRFKFKVIIFDSVWARSEVDFIKGKDVVLNIVSCDKVADFSLHGFEIFSHNLADDFIKTFRR